MLPSYCSILEYDDSFYLKKNKKIARNIVLYLMHDYNNIA